MCEVTFTGSLYYCLRYKGLQVLRCSPLQVAILRPKFTLPSRHFYDQENFRTRTGVQPRFTFLYQFHAYCIVHIALSLLHAFGVVTRNRPFSFPIDPIMGVKRSFETLIEDFREDARLRVAQTNAVSRHLRRIFTATKAFKHPVLADHDWRHWGSSCLNSTFKEHVQMSNSHFTTHYRKQNYRRLTGTMCIFQNGMKDAPKSHSGFV